MGRAKVNLLFLLVGLVLGLMAGAGLGARLSLKGRPDLSQKSPLGRREPQKGVSAREMMEAVSGVFAQAAQKVGSSCVAILAEQAVASRGPSGKPDESRHSLSLGSGVIVSADGLILTNSHVVSQSEKVLVAPRDGKIYPATIIGIDLRTDLAVIKIDAADLPAASFGDSDGVKVGQWVLAVGNPLQMAHTVTAGIISAKGRSSVGLIEGEDFIQTDASINPGNSGGALADLNGDVIGINTAIASPSGGSVGIGLAIPINLARQVMQALITGRRHAGRAATG